MLLCGVALAAPIHDLGQALVINRHIGISHRHVGISHFRIQVLLAAHLLASALMRTGFVSMSAAESTMACRSCIDGVILHHEANVLLAAQGQANPLSGLFANSSVYQVQVVATAPITQEGVGDAKIVASYEKTFLI